MLCPFNKVVGVLGVGIGEAGGVDGFGSDGGHDLCKILGIECSTEGGIDSGDELLIGLFFCEAPDQLGNKICLFGIVGKRQHMQPLKNGQWISNAERNLKAIRKLGAENSILSTDCGNPATPPWEESMRQYLQFMADHNVSRDELRAMTETTPARLLGLTDALD